MAGHGGSSASSYLANPTSPIPSHCASIVVTSTLRVNYFQFRNSTPKGLTVHEDHHACNETCQADIAVDDHLSGEGQVSVLQHQDHDCVVSLFFTKTRALREHTPP